MLITVPLRSPPKSDVVVWVSGHIIPLRKPQSPLSTSISPTESVEPIAYMIKEDNSIGRGKSILAVRGLISTRTPLPIEDKALAAINHVVRLEVTRIEAARS
jgi:hypothetical protein